jgi:hypothetical protein
MLAVGQFDDDGADSPAFTQVHGRDRSRARGDEPNVGVRSVDAQRVATAYASPDFDQRS